MKFSVTKNYFSKNILCQKMLIYNVKWKTKMQTIYIVWSKF